jgi:phosphoenolpyruvate carboxykinase (ATP)
MLSKETSMEQRGRVMSFHGLEEHGITNPKPCGGTFQSGFYEHTLQRYEGVLSHLGPLVVRTGQYTGRSPKDKYIVKEPSSQEKIAWGEINQPFSAERYEDLRIRLMAYLEGKDLFVQDCYVGADPEYRLPMR